MERQAQLFLFLLQNHTYLQLVGSGKKTAVPTSFAGHCGALRATRGNAEVETTKKAANTKTKSSNFFIVISNAIENNV